MPTDLHIDLTRYVRTPAGERYFHEPIGSPIGGHSLRIAAKGLQDDFLHSGSKAVYKEIMRRLAGPRKDRAIVLVENGSKTKFTYNPDLDEWEARDSDGNLFYTMAPEDFRKTLMKPGNDAEVPEAPGIGFRAERENQLTGESAVQRVFHEAAPRVHVPKGWERSDPDGIPDMDPMAKAQLKDQAIQGHPALILKGPHNHVLGMDWGVYSRVTPQRASTFIERADKALQIVGPAVNEKPVLIHVDDNFEGYGLPNSVLAFVNSGDGGMVVVNPAVVAWPEKMQPEDKTPGKWWDTDASEFPLATSVLSHELGHIRDNRHHDTAGPANYTGKPSPRSAMFWRTQFPQADEKGGDQYGQSNAFEGYAEAFSQYWLRKYANAHMPDMVVKGPLADRQYARAEEFAKRYHWDEDGSLK